MAEPSGDDLRALVAGQTVPSRFAATVAARGGAAALRWRRDDGAFDELTFAQYAERACRVAAGLADLGVRAGDRVVLMLRNRPEFHITDMAVLLLGATPISVYNSSPPAQLGYLTTHCGAVVIVVEDRFRATVDAAANLDRVVVVGDDGDWPALLQHDPIDLAAAAAVARPEDLATVIYTSGTTGPPKGVMISHANICFTAESLRVRYRRAEPDLRLVSYLPMAHIAERMTSHYLQALFGYQVTCCPDIAELGDHLVATRPHLIFGVPRVWERILAGVRTAVSEDPERAALLDMAVEASAPMAEARDRGETLTPDQIQHAEVLETMVFAGLRRRVGLDETIFALTGAAPIAPETVRWFRAVGVPLASIYGMSESTGPITWDPYDVRPGTVGRAMPGCEITLLEDGEVAFRGGNAFVGYLADDATTAATMVDGWVRTGDIGELAADGYLSIVDRKKELIVTAGGENVSPANIEARLCAMALVAQAVVIGDNRPCLVALLVLDAEAASAWARHNGITATSLAELADDERLRAEIDLGVQAVNAQSGRVDQVRHHAVLGEVWVPDSAQLTPTMKLKRRAIESAYGDEIEALYRRWPYLPTSR